MSSFVFVLGTCRRYVQFTCSYACMHFLWICISQSTEENPSLNFMCLRTSPVKSRSYLYSPLTTFDHKLNSIEQTRLVTLTTMQLQTMQLQSLTLAHTLLCFYQIKMLYVFPIWCYSLFKPSLAVSSHLTPIELKPLHMVQAVTYSIKWLR